MPAIGETRMLFHNEGKYTPLCKEMESTLEKLASGIARRFTWGS